VESIVLSASYPGMSQEVVLYCDASDCFGKENRRINGNKRMEGWFHYKRHAGKERKARKGNYDKITSIEPSNR
jgi:hypothetical protein